MSPVFYVAAIDAAEAELSSFHRMNHTTAAHRAAQMTNDDCCNPRCEYKVYRVTVTVEEIE